MSSQSQLNILTKDLTNLTIKSPPQLTIYIPDNQDYPMTPLVPPAPRLTNRHDTGWKKTNK